MLMVESLGNIRANQLIITIISIFLTAFATHVFEVNRIRKKQDSAYQAALGEKIVTAYLAVRDLELYLRVYEVFGASLEYARENNEKYEKTIQYPAFMVSRESIYNYCMKVSDSRMQYGPFISSLANAYLNTLEQYLLELAHFIGSYSLWDATKAIGVFALKDVSLFQQEFDELIIREINHPSYKLESKKNKKYTDALKKLKTKFIDESELMKIRNSNDFCEFAKGADYHGAQTEDSVE